MSPSTHHRIRPGLLAPAFALFLAAGCAVYPELRDTTQPNKIKKAALVCDSGDANWEECRRGVPAQWFYRQTVVDAPYEAWWTFVGEQGDAFKISFEITERLLVAYRTYETVKGGSGVRVKEPGYKGEPVAAFAISSHFDVWHQYNSTTGEQLPVLFEATERPWYEREYIRVDWSRNLITGYGNFMGSRFSALFGNVVAEPANYAIDDPKDPDFRILTDDYVDVVTAETHTPMTVSGMDGRYFNQYPVSRVLYRNSFMRAKPSDYQPLYYPDPSFEKFGFFRNEREYYDRERGMTDFKDYLMNRWNLWQKVHSDKRCKAHSECGGAAEDGVTCDLFEKNDAGEGRCTLPYASRGVKPITYYLSPRFPAAYEQASCMVAQGWNVAYKTTIAGLLNKPYTPPELNEEFAANCKVSMFTPPPADGSFDPDKHDLFLLKPNDKSCDLDGKPGQGDRWCYRLGDLRYSQLVWVDQASSGSPLGYGPSAADPITGEIYNANSFIYGAAVESYRSYVADVYDLVTGNLSEDQVRMGENVREYYEQLSGNTFPPTIPQTGFQPTSLDGLNALKDRLGGLKERMEDLKRLGPSARSPNFYALKGSPVERLLFDNVEWKVGHGLDPNKELSEAELDELSPFRPGFHERIARHRQAEQLLSKSENCVYQSNEYTDASVTWLAQYWAAKGLGREETITKILEAVYRGVTEHEVGHNLGLRHNFEGSFDEGNFFERYYQIKAADPDPAPEQFGTLPLTPAQYQAYDQARRAKRLERDAKGIKFEQYSSIMDYGGQFYSDFRGLGRYDIAAIKFGYGERVEHFDGAPNATRSNRVDRPFYLGGEACSADSECPFQRSGQTCLPPTGVANRRMCSSYEQDAARDAASYPPAKYRFCSDERAADRPFCNRWDEGASSTEIVDNMIDTYDRNYIFNNFRRYRRYFGAGYGSRIYDRYFITMGKQFASLLYQFYYNQSAALSSGPGSFNDMLAASVKAMNFFERVLATPDVGAYQKVALEEIGGNQRYIYERVSPDCNDNRGDLRACLGVGKYLWTVWETGYYGAQERIARMGTFNDKLYALIALTTKDWSALRANDETFPISFFDAFRDEMLDLFTGIISGDSRRFAATVNYDPDDNVPFVQYRNRWSGKFWGADLANFSYGSGPVVKFPEGEDIRYATADLIQPSRNSTFLRYYALGLSLQSWPSIYDQTYADYLQLYTFGGPEVRFPADGVATVSYESPLRKKTYMAVQTPDSRSIIFPLVREASQMKAEYDLYSSMTATQAVEYQVRAKNLRRCGSSRTPNDETCRQYLVAYLENELQDRESFLNLTENLMRWLGY